jgi:hypothetical protein
VQVLRGARDVLAHTHVVICEADMDDFQAINQTLVDAGFVKMQEERRRFILKQLDEMLAEQRARTKR